MRLAESFTRRDWEIDTMEPLVFTYDIDGSDFVTAGAASADMKRSLKRMGVDANTIKRAAICMYEGEINLIIHGGGGNAEVKFDGISIEIMLRDQGPGIADVSEAMKEGYSTASQEARDLGFGAGMGLPNMKRNADDFNIESELGKGTTVNMRIKL